MIDTIKGAKRALAAMLLVTVATQIFYVTVVMAAPDDTPLRPATWLTELLMFSGILVVGLTLAIRDGARAVQWLLVGFFGLFNILQIGAGLAMFNPALEAESSVPQLFATVLAGAFFLYLLAKLFLGAAAIVYGSTSLRANSGFARILGGITALAGLGAVVINAIALTDWRAWVEPAGAAGTAVSALFALSLLLSKEQ